MVLLKFDRNTAVKNGFVIVGVPCFANNFVQVGSSVYRMTFSSNNTIQRKAARRKLQA